MAYLYVCKRALLGVKMCLGPTILVSFRGHRKLEPPLDGLLLGGKFKISEEHPRLFYMGVLPPPPAAAAGLLQTMRVFFYFLYSHASTHPCSTAKVSSRSLYFLG